MKVWEALYGLVQFGRAMGVTLRQFLRRPITVQYPDEPVRVYPRFRGRHQLRRYEDGLERCVGCGLCAAYCPAVCIYVEAAENDPEHPVSRGERYARVYEVNLSRCIFCGYCVEACPTGALTLGHAFELARDSRGDLVLGKADLLEPAPARVVVLEDGS